MWCIIDTLILLGYGVFSHSHREKILADTIRKQMVTKILYFGANQYVLLATTKNLICGTQEFKGIFLFFFPPILYRLFLRIFKAWKFYFIFHIQFYQCSLMKVLASICQKKIVNLSILLFTDSDRICFSTLALQHANTIIEHGLLWPWESNMEDEEICKCTVKAVAGNIFPIPSNLIIYLTVLSTKQTKKCVLERINGRIIKQGTKKMMGSKFTWGESQIMASDWENLDQTRSVWVSGSTPAVYFNVPTAYLQILAELSLFQSGRLFYNKKLPSCFCAPNTFSLCWFIVYMA